MFNKGNCTIVVANGRVAVMTESQATANSEDMIRPLNIKLAKLRKITFSLFSKLHKITFSLLSKLHSLFFQNYTKLHSLFFQERTGPTSLRGRLKMGDDHRYQVFASANIISSECSDCISRITFLEMYKLYLEKFLVQ